ncbi:hypothetical protein G6L28_22400 [Agrobacterium larrymoorei]|uniref:hypothetical protein n=1 Tax=Agrobacterium larrymoorei TaxID=160699 RepID=UPI0015717381|nr:hypothetical protein [Agrobacterium larrymoorei]NTJ45322.1 hypothetical protein [Agrobacterium larrymoorei]
MSDAEALRRNLAKAYFPNEIEAFQAGKAASRRDTMLSVVQMPFDAHIPLLQLRLIVADMHAGTSDEELIANITARCVNWPLGRYPDYVAKACAYALASHRSKLGINDQSHFLERP